MPTEGRKYDNHKLRYDKFPFEALDQIAAVFTCGAIKYEQGDDDNWKKVDNLKRRYRAAALRHISAEAQGKTSDPETGLPHLAHAVCCLLFMMWDERDTYPRDFERIFEEMQKKYVCSEDVDSCPDCSNEEYCRHLRDGRRYCVTCGRFP